MPTYKHARKKRDRRWIARVKTTAVDVPEGTMKRAMALVRRHG